MSAFISGDVGQIGTRRIRWEQGDRVRVVLHRSGRELVGRIAKIDLYTREYMVDCGQEVVYVEFDWVERMFPVLGET